MTYYLKG